MTDTNTYIHPELTPITQRPTYHTLHTSQQEVNANALAVYTNRGGGEHGHLYLVVSPETYATQAGAVNIFEAPTNPGPRQTHPQPSTSAQITEINRQYLVNKTEFEAFNKVKQDLKHQVLKAIMDKYTQTLADRTYGYANVTVLQLLQHLHNTYGIISPDDLAKNEKSLGRRMDNHR